VLYGVLFLLQLLLLVYCVIDVGTTPADRVRTLPKPAWLVLVVLLPLLGGIAWFLAGRPQGATVGLPRRSARPTGPAARASSPDDDEDFLRGLRQRAAEQRRAEQERDRRDQDGTEGDAPAR